MNIILRRSLLRSYSITRAGESFRLQQGVMRSGNEDGPLHDLPDFHYADGRPAQETPKQMRWKKTRENEMAILNRIKSEVIDQRKQVTDKIDAMQKHIQESIKNRREKKKQKEELFNKSQESSSSSTESTNQ
eukprot:gene5093-6337_t